MSCDNKSGDKKTWTESERLALAAQLDAELDEYINGLEKRSYAEGWPEDRWEEEMDKHPFFMKESPNPGEELSPLMEGLQKLKYDESENTPEELANNYKDDGNFNFKHKKYRLAILAYTEGLKTKSKDNELMAQLYNNRAAAHFMLQNYWSSLNDNKRSLKLKPKYPKVQTRLALCCLKIKDYNQCISVCDEFLQEFPTDKEVLKLREEAVAAKKRSERDTRRQQIAEKKKNQAKEKLIEVLKARNVNLELPEKGNINLTDLEPRVPQLADFMVHLNEENKLIWPVLIKYPESLQTDFIQNFHEDETLTNHLEMLFEEPPEWDTKRQYISSNVNVYYEGKDKSSIYKVDTLKTLGSILSHKSFVIRGGTPTFLILVALSEAEKKFLSNYRYILNK
ncbi:tetratricopeptide repeat protein 4 [Orussus abietinus]|uniref:tetratricopeptide repeat protein 4 n=1 Tax=Orussus abietinus TaxID=222816 RepID=UPI0006252779|nr:tetratricopeptide repeat protein 4 [Orussus abietinus]